MRIHRLEISAFGPFSGTETIDFDALSDAGLFLVCGPTGAGKTTVLDAVCFGLYGEVPGDRNSAKRLRSDHTAPGIAPRVVLEVTLSGRRFRIGRSPAWQRPKRRGTGSTSEQARVTLEELAPGGWVHLSSRLDETAHLVTDLVGMNLTQFCQVAMLPQGRFQAFLRARSDDRHKVLQQLFRTSRFEQIEKWLVSHRQSLRTANAVHHDAVSAVVSRISESSGVALPEQWDPRELTSAAESGELADWSEDLVRSADLTAAAARGELVRVNEETTEIRTGLERARAAAALRKRHHEAQTVRAALDATREKAAEDAGRLDASERATVVLPLVRLAREAARTADQAQEQVGVTLAEAAARLDSPVGDLTPEDLAGAERHAQQASAVARALLPREAELKAARSSLSEAQQRLDELSAEADDLDRRCRSLPAELVQLRGELVDITALAGAVPELDQAEQRLRQQLGNAIRLSELETRVIASREELQRSVDLAQSLREAMHDIRERRINGMAAELATALASGESCPVCGSEEHPAVARPTHGAPTAAEEDRARSDYETADFSRQAYADALVTLERSRDLAAQACEGKSADVLGTELAELLEQRSAAQSALARQQQLAESIKDLEEELTEAQDHSARLSADRGRLEHERDTAQHTIDSVSQELSTLFSQGALADDLQGLIDDHSQAGEIFAAARDALTTRDTAAARAEETAATALATANEQGFRDTAAAAQAQLSGAERLDLQERLRSREARSAAAQAVLDAEDVLAAVREETPDLPRLEADTARLEQRQAACSGRVEVADARARRLAALHLDLTAELASWEPTRAAYTVAQSLSTFVEGKGGDNQLQMRLSAYVLAARLRQVVAAANHRLSAMSDKRYTLEHSDSRGVGEQRGGLSLLIRDEWTGESRDPATLSGGETFVASLALALGLADVVSQEAGGSEIDTLFIDEGFGSLDSETLDDVMDTLDGLRDGGRVVGIVSHVPEMRTRITSQLQIHKDRSGSHVAASRELV
jgi:exonuclease SbcC